MPITIGNTTLNSTELIETTKFSFYKVFDIDGNMVFENTNHFKVLDKCIELLLKDRKVKVHHGPGLLWDLDLDRGVIPPEGEYHNTKLPPFYIEILDEETLKKLK